MPLKTHPLTLLGLAPDCKWFFGIILGCGWALTWTSAYRKNPSCSQLGIVDLYGHGFLRMQRAIPIRMPPGAPS